MKHQFKLRLYCFEIDFTPQNTLDLKSIKKFKNTFLGKNWQFDDYEETRDFLLYKVIMEDYSLSADGIFFKQNKDWYYFNSQTQPQTLFVSTDGKKFISSSKKLDASAQIACMQKLLYYEQNSLIARKLKITLEENEQHFLNIIEEWNVHNGSGFVKFLGTGNYYSPATNSFNNFLYGPVLKYNDKLQEWFVTKNKKVYFLKKWKSDITKYIDIVTPYYQDLDVAKESYNKILDQLMKIWEQPKSVFKTSVMVKNKFDGLLSKLQNANRKFDEIKNKIASVVYVEL